MSCITRENLCPASGDTENVLLQKILQSLNAGGSGVTGLSVNGGPFQTGDVSIVTGGGGGVSSVNGDPGPAVLLDSGEIPESGNLYFTTARVRATDLTGFSAAVGGTVTAADTILDALGKFEFRVALNDAKATGSDRVLRAGDTMTGALLLPSGSSATPPLSFSGDPNTGLYNPFSDVLSLVAGGLDILVLDGLAVTAGFPFRGIAGSAASPSFSFTSDSNTGLFWTGVADTLGISTGGVVRLTLSTTTFVSTLPFQGPNGGASAPTFSFSGDPDTGIYQTGGGDSLGFTTGGTSRAILSASAFSATVSLWAPVGSAASPSHSFGTDTNTGMYQGGADILGLSTGGTVRLTLTSTSIFAGVVFQFVAGAVGSPGLQVSGDPDTGIYSGGANILNFGVGASQKLSLTATQIIASSPVVGPTGSAATPTFSFTGDPDTGLYNIGADQLGLATGGVLRITYNTTDTILAAGYRLAMSSGANQRAGNAVLVAGTVTVANTSVTANTVVLLTRKTAGGTTGDVITYTVTAATSFTITSDSATDTSTFSYLLIEVP